MLTRWPAGANRIRPGEILQEGEMLTPRIIGVMDKQQPGDKDHYTGPLFGSEYHNAGDIMRSNAFSLAMP